MHWDTFKQDNDNTIASMLGNGKTHMSIRKFYS